ncbi:diflavin flavoprotein [Leptolyngbya cf. ectocarpi LEGE 11479]|uniref:Diflavin flavoprotein n=1 Tax=Leptolyngbya cf. ectocarpi LEGE 11479 TaxID=1828722 RepID=A0A928ZX21_LEPEC|nr:diflavin flavoprotein [Leptolyngbya ectocarpi]MBE9069010.1 diflavin flavoprotein [Leptolyngbya cf. ectocarpi LEGE 11479]
MVVAAPNLANSADKRLTLTTGDLADNTTVIRSLDWDRDRFDIEFGLQNGTTYNSYLVCGEKTALIDTSHAKFRQIYMDALTGLVDPKEIDYIVISHTEPDHSGLVKDVLDLAPQAVVVGAKVAVKFLEDLVHQPFESMLVKNGDTLDLGKGHVLKFVSAPNLHWPDTIFTYDQKTGLLYTCDAFGAHYCTDDTFDEDLEALSPDFRFYYECLMAPNARSVLSAMKRMDKLGEISTIATGHGPLIRHNLEELTERYRRWSNEKSKAENMVAVFYVSDYGYCDRISQALAKGITKTGVAVEMMDMRLADPHNVTELVGRAKGILLGMPPLTGQGAEETQTALSSILAAVNNKQTFGLFESYGGDDEPIDTLHTKLQDLDLKVAFDPIRVKDTPSEALYQLCDETGTDLGQDLAQAKKIKKIKSLDADLQKALGRISSGLYIITAAKGEVTSAMLASWISQASFQPLGFTIAVAKDRAIESLMQVGDTFVLNILEEGNHLPLMKHFLKRFPPGADRFAGIRTRPAENKSPILADALAYLECTVNTRMELTDHWLVYCTVEEGKVSKDEAITAVHHRKIGNYY